MLRCRSAGTSFASLPKAVTRFLCALIALAGCNVSFGLTWTWTGAGGNANWSTVGNWNLGSAPTSASTTALTFSGTTNTGTALTPLNQNIATPFQLDMLTFGAGSSSFYLGGNALAFTGTTNTITQLSSNAQFIANNLTASVNGMVTLTLAGGASGMVTMSGAINSGAGSRDYAITKTGTSTFTLSGANTYGGATTISAGVLTIQNASALGSTVSGTSVASGAALQIQGGIAVGTEALSLNGSGVSNGGAFRNVSGNNSFAGAITFGSASTISSDGGTLTLSGNVNNGGFLFTESGAGNVTITGVISGSGGLTKSGAGTLTLSGASSNTYTGVTTVNQGTLVLAKPGSVLAPAITIGGAGSTATVQLGANFQLYGANTTVNAQGQLNLNNFQEYIGTLTVSGGGSVVTGTGLLYIGGGITSTAGSVTSTMTGSYSLYTNQIFNIASGSAPSGVDLNISGSLAEYLAGTTVTKQGAGKLVLSGANSYTGLTTITAGTVEIQNASGLGTTANGTTIASGAELEFSGNIAVGNESLTLNGAGASGNGALRNMSGNNSLSGGITLGSASTVSSDAGLLTLSGGIVNGGFALTFAGAGNITESGVISGSGALNKTGSGTLSLGGVNTYTGATTITGGTLQISTNERIANTSNLNVSGGTFDLGVFAETTGAVTLFSGSIAGTGAGTLTGSSYTFESGTVSAIVAGPGTVTKNTSGLVILSGNNTYSGATTINAGTLQVSSNNGLGTTANGTTVAAGAALNLNNVNYTTTEALSLNGTGVANGGALTNTGTSTFAGAITIATNATINAGGGTLNLTGGLSKNGTTLTFAGGGTVNITNNGITGASPNSDLVVDGTTVVLSAASTYNGPTTIQNSGTLKLGQSNVLPTAPQTAMTVTTSGTFDLAGHSDGIASLSGDSTAVVKNSVVGGTSTLTVNPGSGVSTTFSGTIAGTNGGTQGEVALQKDGAGTLILAAANTYGGATTVNAGTLLAVAASGGALGKSSAVLVNWGGTLLLGANDQINDIATLTLAGGTFAKGNFSEGSASSAGVGALSLTSGSTIDFGSGSVGVLTFASFSPGAFNLTIDNWTGAPGIEGTGSTDRLIFASDQSANLGNFVFTGYGSGAREIDLGNGYFEVVAAVPEPSTFLALGLILLPLARHLRARRKAARE